tara:strand:+ start:1269 stop:1508 length:240 start_codon:yes stop_codon:yes gene_type:complete
MTNAKNDVYDVRVIKHANAGYDVFANFRNVAEAVSYMRNWNAAQMHNWFIIDANGTRLQMDNSNKLVVTYSGLGVLATK